MLNGLLRMIIMCHSKEHEEEEDGWTQDFPNNFYLKSFAPMHPATHSSPSYFQSLYFSSLSAQ